MKISIFLLVIHFAGLYSISANAQWITLQVPGLPNSVNPQLLFSAVNENVCWGIDVNNSQYILTRNGGSNWEVSTIIGANGLRGSSIAAIDGYTAYVAMNDPSNATSGGIFKTTNGGITWAKQSSAFPGSGGHPADIHFFDASNGVVIGDPNNGDWEIYTTTNGGVNWNQITNIPSSPVDDLTADGFYASYSNNIWFGTWGGESNAFAIYRSTDRGYTWERFQQSGLVTFSLSFKDDLNGLAANCFMGGDKISKTTDGGVTWTALQYGEVYPSTLNISYVKGTEDCYLLTSSENVGLPVTLNPGSRASVDGGTNWMLLMDNAPHGPASFSDDGWGWSGGLNDQIYKIYKDAVTPVELTSFNANSVGNDVELRWKTASEINNHGFEIYRNGYKISFVDGKGTTTEEQNYSFTDKNLKSGIYNYRLNQIDFDGTQKVVGELTINLTLPEQFTLEQNYPNPFNPSTTIRYSIPVSGFVSLKVYNTLGAEVASLVNEEKPAGNYELNFKAAGLVSGVYFYRLHSGNFEQTKKLILMK